MVAGPKGEKYLQVRIDQRRAALIVAALSHAITDGPWALPTSELEELLAWFILRYIRLYKETPPALDTYHYDTADA